MVLTVQIFTNDANLCKSKIYIICTICIICNEFLRSSLQMVQIFDLQRFVKSSLMAAPMNSEEIISLAVTKDAHGTTYANGSLVYKSLICKAPKSYKSKIYTTCNACNLTSSCKFNSFTLSGYSRKPFTHYPFRVYKALLCKKV